MRTIIYSLRTINDKTILSIDLGARIVFEDQEIIRMDLDGQELDFKKSAYVNSMRVIDNGKVFFTFCSKSVNRKFVYNKLIEYQISKLDTRVNHILMIKKKLQKEMIAA